ncbi:hypothetical protein ATCC90586_002035 [Pythium insidiosum]|nr:hypothetical protein ATCC90586_002035 [Pythium insidiosum]
MVPLERLELQKKWLDDTSYREWVTVSIRSPDSVLSMREKVRETVFRHNLLRSFEQELPNEVYRSLRLSRGFDKVKWKKLFVEWELVSKSSRKKNLSYRRAIVALDEDGKPDWSTHVIRLSPAPAIKNLREWSLQVTLRRNSVFQFGHIARGVQALDVLQVSEDFSTFSSANVDIQLRSNSI